MRKKRILILLIISFVLSSKVYGQSFSGSFTLNCIVKGKESGMLFLNKYNLKDGSYKTDSVIIKDGKCSFSGSLKEPFQAVISDGRAKSYHDPNFTSIFIDNQIIDIILEWGNFKNIIIKGSPIGVIYEKHVSLQIPLIEKLNQLNKIIHSDADSLTRANAEAELENVRINYDQLESSIIESNPDSYYSAYLLDIKKSTLSLEKLEAYYNSLTNNVKEGVWAKSVKSEIDMLKSLQTGNSAPDFTSIDIKGNRLSLSDFTGKYVLVDFWASWCIPCRKGNPHLKELYKKYNSKGFEIICVADDDSSQDKWKNAIEKDGIEMFHHILRGLKIDPNNKFDRSNDISDKFAIHLLPTKYLIDRNGIIVGKLDNEQLDQKLKEIFGF